MANYQSLEESLQEGIEKMNQEKDGHICVDDSDISQDTGPLRIILVGRSGAGKSATGNTILGQKVFESKLGAQAVTTKCQLETGMWNGRRILVVDTPAIFEPSVWTEEMYKEIGECYLLSSPGPHALVLVTQIGRYTARDKEAVGKVKKIFGVEVMKHLVILFTRKEDLGQSLDDYITNNNNRDLQQGILECDRRFCAFNNRATEEEQKVQVAELMTIIQRLENDNGGKYYSNGLYLDAEKFQKHDNRESKINYQNYLQQVKFQIQKQTLRLSKVESNCIILVCLEFGKWISSDRGISLSLLCCGLVFIAFIVAICLLILPK